MKPVATAYEESGRRDQKARTREALVAATRRLLADGADPSVEDAAAAARISRSTAYRYFPDRQSLLLAVYPQIDRTTLLPDDAPTEPFERLDRLVRSMVELNLDWEPQLRAALRVSLQPGAERPVMRGGRAIAWVADALAPLRDSHPDLDVERLAVAIRSATGIEALVWLVDVAGLDRPTAKDQMAWSARAMLASALAGSPPP